MPNYFEMEMAADIAEDLYKRRKLKEQWGIEMTQRWERMKSNASSEATFHHPAEMLAPNASHPYIPLDALVQPRLIKPSSGKGRSWQAEQMTKISNPTFPTTPEERAKEQAKEKLDILNYVEAQVIKAFTSVPEEEQKQIEESVNAQMERFKQQANQHNETNQTYQQVGDVVEKLREQIAKGDNSEETRSLFSEGCQLLRMMAKRMTESEFTHGTVVAGTACASQCQSDILNSANGRPELSHGEVKNIENTRKLRGRPVSEGRVS